MRTVILRSLIVCVATGCAAPNGSESRSVQLLSTDPIRGYRHELTRSKFRPGTALESRLDQGFQKVIGMDGVFAVRERTGWAAAVPNGGAPSTRRPRYPGVASDHNARVLSYFKVAGLPEEQIGGVHVHTLMEGSGLTASARPTDKLVAYYSLLERVVDGVPVADSFAWARFNADDEIVEEELYWPDLPSALHSQISEFKQKLADPQQAAALDEAIARSQPGLGNTEKALVVFHTNAVSSLPPSAGVAVNVLPVTTRGGKSGRRPTLQFDITGARVAQEQETSQMPAIRR